MFISRTLIDYVIVYKEDKDKIKVELLDDIISDHRIVNIMMNSNGAKTKTQSENKIVVYTDYKTLIDDDARKCAFLNDLKNKPWKCNIANDDIEEMLDELIKNISQTLKDHVETKSIRIKNIHSKNKWYDKEIRIAQKERNNLFRKAKCVSDSEAWSRYTTKRNEVVSLIRRKKSIYYTK